ncbi:hypothetical protein KC947_00240 [Candidatus Saccharibacteria bacterium]|nr:hypothetical protein [Candidatus Saccharibacteria bacterium]
MVDQQYPVSSRQMLAYSQESIVVDELTESLQGSYTDEEIGLSRLAFRHLFRSGYIRHDETRIPEPLSLLFQGNSGDDIRELLDEHEEIQALGRLAFIHGVRVYG